MLLPRGKIALLLPLLAFCDRSWVSALRGLKKGKDAADDVILAIKKGKDSADDVNLNIDHTMREGLDESPGVTALEYLGTGYNLVEGNPRGGSTNEIDPGFRSGVLKLINDQSVLSNNGEFTVPLGTELRYLSACEYSSSAQEVSTASSYQQELVKESGLSISAGISGNIAGFLFERKLEYSKSERYTSFSQNRAQSQTNVFESRALCTEYEGKVLEYAPRVLQHHFQDALDSLPTPFDGTSEAVVNAYRRFIREYGTHYIKKVILGAKLVYSTYMQSTDVSSLVSQGTAVSEGLGAKAMIGYDRQYDVSAGLSAPIPKVPGAEAEVSVATTVTYNGEASAAVELSEFQSQQRDALNAIFAKIENVEQVNIGGNAPSSGDWVSWAASARDRPMPIQYDLAGLDEFMSDELAESFIDALEYIYVNVGSGLDDVCDVEDVLHFGIAAADGSPITPYTYDPLGDENLRAITARKNPDVAEDRPHYRYDVYWEGSKKAFSGVFASLIHQSIAPNVQEDTKSLGFLDSRLSEDYSYIHHIQPYGLQEKPGQASLAMYQNPASQNELRNFNFLFVENLPSVAEVIMGVVNPLGFAANKVFGQDVGFEVSLDNDKEYIVTFSQAFDSPPTVVVFPMWFPSELGRSPEHAGEVAIGLRDCSTAQCRVRVSADNLEDDGNWNGNTADVLSVNEFLGFSFLALEGEKVDCEDSAISVLHGNIAIDPTDRTISYPPGRGFTAQPVFDVADTFNLVLIEGSVSFPVSNQVVGGVLVTFDEPFLDMPSVIASPLIGARDIERVYIDILGGSLEYFSGPVSTVEHVTPNQVFIKSGFMIDFLGSGSSYPLNLGFGSSYPDYFAYEPLSFHFVAVGPQA